MPSPRLRMSRGRNEIAPGGGVAGRFLSPPPRNPSRHCYRTGVPRRCSTGVRLCCGRDRSATLTRAGARRLSHCGFDGRRPNNVGRLWGERRTVSSPSSPKRSTSTRRRAAEGPSRNAGAVFSATLTSISCGRLPIVLPTISIRWRSKFRAPPARAGGRCRLLCAEQP